MRYQQLNELGGMRSFVLVFDREDAVPDVLLDWAREHHITAASFTGIGAFSELTLGYFLPERREYEEIPIAEQVELLSLAGNVALDGDEPKVHAHVVVGKRDGTAHGGHLLHARVRPTLELILVESSATMRRTLDRATGLPLLDPEAMRGDDDRAR